MSKTTLAGVSALLLAPLTAFVGVAILPTVSDYSPAQVAALTDHRGAMIAGMALQTIAIALLIGGVIWLAHVVAPGARTLAVAGGVLAVAGSLIPLWQDGVTATYPTLVAALDPAHATTAIDHIHNTGAISALEPLALLGDLGLALLGLAAVKNGAPRWAAVAVTIGAFSEGAGFGSATRPLILAGFAILFVGLAAATRALLSTPAERIAREPVPA
jgi:hypothetical protein